MNEAPMDFTGERYIPELKWPEVSYEHWHRYVYAERLVAGKSVLDVACGEGYGSHWLARRAKSVVGVDISEEAIAHARLRYTGENLSFLQGGADLLPLEGEGLFEVVTSFETIEHIDIPTQERFVGEIKRVLKPGGVLLISTPNKHEYSDVPNYSNDFHIKEFYEGEFVEFLGRFFRHVSLLGQRVYPASFVWPLGEYRDSEIRQMHLGEHGFGPLSIDARRPIYFVAIASDEPCESAGSSTLIDVSSQALNDRQQELIDRTVAWQKELAARHMLEQANQALNHRVAELATFVDRCHELMAQVEQITRERSVLHNSLAESQSRCHELETELDQLSREKSALRDLLAESQNRCHELGTELDQVARERSQLRDIIAEIQSSTTWRLSHRIKGLLGRGKPSAA
jgi:SAM-dependent methyltransferase